MVEETLQYLRLDGEHGGEIVALDAAHAGELAGIRRMRYDGTRAAGDAPTRSRPRRSPPATSIAATAPHFLLKEITESPRSMRKTLRGKIVERDGVLHAVVGERALTPDIAARLAAGTITRIRVIGQGTAAIAGQSTAALLDELSDGALDVDAVLATELSGFQLRLDMQRHARDRRQPERHHDRHQPHGRPAARPRARR